MLSTNDLLNLRNKINNIDEQIIILLEKRKKLVLNIAKSKIENNQPIRDLTREKSLLNKLTNLGKKKNLNTNYITRLFKLIIEESILIQNKLLKKFKNNNYIKKNIFAFLGPKGSYSHIAVSKYIKKYANNSVEKTCLNFQEVIESIENNHSNYAILPIENNCSGPINEIFHILKNINLFIVGEISIHIDHCLLGLKNIELNNIKKIYSHSQPLKQCSNFIQQFPKWKIKHAHSTTDAIQKVIQHKQTNCVAIGSKISNKIYKLKILSNNISNKKNNITRFIVLSKTATSVRTNNLSKTTIIFALNKTIKEFYEIISILKNKNIIVHTLIFNNINKNTQEKIFYLDIQKNLSSNIIQHTIKKIRKITNFFKILGCYPIKN